MGKLADALSRPVTNAGRIAAQLRSEIVERRVPAGHRLGVTELAIRFGVSGAPVREALQQLGDLSASFDLDRLVLPGVTKMSN